MKLTGLVASPGEGEELFDGLNLELEPGSYTLVCGPTGSGKSTLAMILAGCFAGQVKGTLQGGPVAVVWQDPGAQMCGQTLLDEVRLPMDYQQVPARESTRRATELLRLVRLDHLPPGSDPMLLSGGEQQRLALAAALAQGAQVLVLDEATSQLDHQGRADFLAAIESAAPTATVLVVDHDPSPHLARADRVIVLAPGGKVISDGPSLPPNSRELGIRLPGGGLWGTEGLGHWRKTLVPPAVGEDGGSTTAGGTSSAPPLKAQRPQERGGPGWEAMDLGFARFLRGAVVAVVGRNGAGKSTLLRRLARRKDLVRRGIGWVPQRGANHLLGHSVRAELAACPSSHGLQAAGLTDLAHRHPLALSGGQRQRLAVARALGGAPIDLALLDEPSYSQDLPGTRLIARMILAGSRDRVTLMATHDRLMVEHVATHVARMEDGQVVEVREL